MKKLPVALQLYTVRDQTAKDFVGTVKKVAEMGYQGVEFAGYGDIPAAEMKKLLDDLGLQAVSSHVPIETLEDSLDEIIEYNKVIGGQYIAVPWLAEDRRPGKPAFDALIPSIERIGRICKENGIQLCYHNHDFEFKKLDGEYYLDILYKSTDPDLVQMEVDTYWVKYAGLVPAEYIRKYPGRCPLVHLKDMEDTPERAFAEVGNGTQDLPSIFAAAEDVGAKWYIVEQDACKRPTLESARISIENLRRLGL